MIVSGLIPLINEDKWEAVLGFCTTVASLSGFFSSYIAQHFQEQAASIQQYFDVTLFSKILGKKRELWGNLLPDTEIIFNISTLVREEDIKDVENWYNEIPGVSGEIQVYYCQRENIRWSYKLTQKAVVFSWVSAGLFLVLGIALAILRDVSVIKVFCTLSWQLITWGIFCGICIELTNTWWRWKSLNDESNAIWQERKQVEENVFIQKLINLQHGIREMRATCFLLPDWMYKLLRNPFEDCEAQLVQILQEEASEDHTPSSPSVP